MAAMLMAKGLLRSDTFKVRVPPLSHHLTLRARLEARRPTLRLLPHRSSDDWKPYTRCAGRLPEIIEILFASPHGHVVTERGGDDERRGTPL